MQICCEIFNTDYYELYYKQLENFLGKEFEMDAFANKIIQIEEIIREKEKPDNLGEIKSALMAAILYLVEEEQINVFISDDRKARTAMFIEYSEKYHFLRGLSVSGMFYILRKTMSKETAKEYMNEIPYQVIKIDDTKGNRIKKAKDELIDIIYEGKVKLLNDGELRLREE